jgi:hypothetical protein
MVPGQPGQPGQGRRTASILAASTPPEQKRMLGEQLFPRIQRMFPNWPCQHKIEMTNLVVGRNIEELLMVTADYLNNMMEDQDMEEYVKDKVRIDVFVGQH